ncbi:NUDIX hydrolase [Sessilibacter sp. MAH2]
MPNFFKQNLLSIENLLVQQKNIRNAGVLVGLVPFGDDYSVVLTRRASHLKSHAGEVALPGGKWEPQDANLIATALRETHEEIGLEPSAVELMGCLPLRASKLGVNVVPVVGIIETLPVLIPNQDELDEVFLVPLSFLREDLRTRTDIFHRAGKDHWAPAWQFECYEIWGLTARILVDLMQYGFDVNLTREHQAPERTY